jgi:serine/threonine protein kinase
MDRVLIGTPGYMAPETLLNNEYSYKCDVWALGNIFVEMLTGQAPFMNTQSLEQLKTMFKSSIQLKLENISKTSCELVECMLQLDKNERISIEELYNMFCVADGSILKKQNIHGRQINKNSSSLKWNINKKEILDGRADCKLHLL